MSKQKFRPSSKDSSKRLAWSIAVGGTIVSTLILVMLFSIGKSDQTLKEKARSDEVIDLLQTPQESDVEVVEITSSEIGIELRQGGWVQQTDRMGKLVQQYRCEALDPNPAGLPTGWIEMTEPEVELFLSDNRMVRITGESGIANAPKRLLESGEIAGHVKIELFDLSVASKDSLSLQPTMVLTTPQVSFDNFIGEITCDSEVRITSPTQTLQGRRLSVRFNDLEDRIEYLRLDELDYIEIYPSEYSTTVYPKPVASSQRAPSTIARSTTRRVHASAIGKDIDYYIVTLSKNVAIIQGDQLTGRVARGDAMTLAFSSESSATSTKHSSSNTQRSLLIPMSMPSAIAAATLTSIQSQTPQEEPIRITCDNGLTMVPLESVDLLPTVPDEIRVELLSNEGSTIVLLDNSNGLSATGEMLRYEVQQDRTDLFGTPATLLLNDMLTTANHLWIARDDGKGGVVGEGTVTGAQQTVTNATLTWEEGVDFSFAPVDDGSQGELKEVTCHGNVELVNQGSVINCDALNVRFSQAKDGSSAPSVAIATGHVIASSDTQVLWADEAQVHFKHTNASESEDNAMFGNSQADRMKATGDVQVLLQDGGRAFCDQLDGDVSQESALLSGNVVIAYNRMLMNRGDTATLTLDRTSGSGIWKGPGQALFLEKPLDVSPNHRIDRPIILSSEENSSLNDAVTMRANWNDSMRLDQNFNDGAGAIDLIGQVEIRSQRSKFDRSQMTGEDLRLEFEFAESNAETIDSNTQGTQDRNERQLRKVIARNNAQIEHRLFDELDPDSKPVVYYIGGNHIEYDPLTQEALAVGQGELVLRDPREPRLETHQSALAGRGTTRFTWDRKLKTTRLSARLYRLEMNGNVQMLHKGLDNSAGMLTSDSIEAIAADPLPHASTEIGVSQVALRGMDLQQLKADGSVIVVTNTRRVDCDEFDYNLSTGISKLFAHGNRPISISTEGTPYPVLATSIIWNMDPAIDTITIRNLQGASPQ